MNDDKQGWKQFKRIKLDRKQLVSRAKKVENASQRHAHHFIVRRLDNIRMVSHEVTIWLLIVGAIIGGLGVQLVWNQHEYTTQASAAGGTYVEGVVGTIDTLNPLYVSTNSEASASRLLFSSLYNYDAVGSLHQDLAQGMTIDDSHKVYTVTVRSNARWHDGKPVTAKDIVFTLNLIKNPAVRSPLRVNWTDVAVSAPTNTTLQFTLPAPYAAFPHALTFPVLPEHILGKVSPGALRESTFSQSPLGSGPFSFRLLQQADAVSHHKVVHLIANPSYYGGAPKINRFELHAYSTNEAMRKALKVGELSAGSDVATTALNDFTGSDFSRIAVPIDSGVYALFNLNSPILKEAGVRKALQVGTNTDALRQAIGGDQLPLGLPVLSNQIWGNDVPISPPYDATKAQGILDEAGWNVKDGVREKDGKKLELTITTIKDNQYEKAVSVLEQQWQQLGVTTHHRVVDTSSVASTFVQDTLQARNFDVLLYELAIGADPDIYAYWHSSQIGQTGYNFSNYTNKTADANLASARARLEPELRNAKYKQFARQWLADVPAIGLYQPVLEYVTNNTVTSLAGNTRLVTAADRYANVQYWTVHDSAVYKTP